MNALVERVARALVVAEIARNPQEFGFERSEHYTAEAVERSAELNFTRRLPLAKAAIEATLIGLREPSEAILGTGWLHLPTPYEQSGEDDGALRLCWRAMIDQALVEVRQS